ncbi:MAG: hypothetical protein M1829_000355 [Trizodia sp. TS-e1964]|nr:MAG: hypothetical protein M1829_000355 [Trizodia sp. TS-e1964]
MADPLTVVGIVANIVQLVDFSFVVIARLNDFHSKTGDVPKCFRDINAQLPALLEALRHTKDRIDNGTFQDSTKDALSPAIEGCRNQIETLDKLLAKTLPAVGDSRLKKSTKAFLSIKQETKVEEISNSLSRYIATLTFYHISASSNLQPLKNTKLVEIRRWLASPDSSVNYHKAKKLCQPNTGLWLLESENFKRWKENESTFMWLHGIPGCGKTILSSTVTNDIISSYSGDPGVVVAYFYFDFTDIEKQKPDLMVRSLISQLSEKCVEMPADLEALYSSCDGGNRQPSLDALIEVLHAMLKGFPQSYLILDALDECADRAILMEILEQMSRWQLKKMHVMVTSRKELDIEISLEAIVNEEHIVCLQSQLVDKDIETYVHQRLSIDRGLTKWQKDAEISQEIETTLIKGSRGIRFRWAVCQMDSLGKCRTRLALQKALKALPKTLDETYERILCTISDNDSEYAIRILRWLVFSIRPLSMRELAEVVSIDIERKPAIDRNEILEDPIDVLDICLSLVSVVMTEANDSTEDYDSTKESSKNESHLSATKSGIVTLAHYSVKEYLVSTRICQGQAMRYSMQALVCHGYIAECCINYLLQFEKDFFNDFESSASLREVYALAQYSAEHWIVHTYNSGENYNLVNCLATKFLIKKDGPYLNWLRLYNPDLRFMPIDFQKELDQLPSPLYFVSLGGLAKTASRLAREGADINAQGGEYGNALQAASYRGHEKTVELLLSEGADINAQGSYYGNALQAASYRGHEKTVELLLSKGADINAQGSYYGNALQAASYRGHEKTVELLLSKGADINAQGGQFGNALCAASSGGHEKTVELLLSKGADINAQGGLFGNALQAASYGGHEKTVELLLSKGADINAQGSYYGNALQAASYRGHEKTVELLLSKGADINAQGGEYGNALQAASYGGHEKTVELLLSKGADINAQGGDLGNALQAASYSGHEKTVELLLSKGADINAQGGLFGNALQAASYGGHDKTVELLLSKGADINAQGGEYGNALQAASYGGHEKTVELLLSKGADINAQGGGYGNALQAASFVGHEKIVELLLRKGADIEARNNYGLTALLWAASYGQEQVVKLLLEKGAQIEAKDNEGNTALARAVSGRHKPVVQLFLESGAESEAIRDNGWTALRQAASRDVRQ